MWTHYEIYTLSQWDTRRDKSKEQGREGKTKQKEKGKKKGGGSLVRARDIQAGTGATREP